MSGLESSLPSTVCPGSQKAPQVWLRSFILILRQILGGGWGQAELKFWEAFVKSERDPTFWTETAVNILYHNCTTSFHCVPKLQIVKWQNISSILSTLLVLPFSVVEI